MSVAGEIVMTSKVFCHVISEDVRSEVCDHCLLRPQLYAEIRPVTSLRRCTSCQVVYFCGRDCQRRSWKEHKIECEYLKRIKPRVPSDTVRYMLRILHKLELDESAESLPDGTLRKFSDLLTHETEVRGSKMRMEAFYHYHTVLEMCIGVERFPALLVFQVFCRILINSVGITDDFQESVGKGLYLAFSVLDHSCLPNVNVVFKGRFMEIRAMEPIPGPILSNARISYYSGVLPTSERQVLLKEQYYFTCSCPLCTKDLPKLYPGLICLCCSASVSLSDSSCGKCETILSQSRVENYKSKHSTACTFNTLNTEDLFELFDKLTELKPTTDTVLLKLSDEILKRGLEVGDMSQCVRALETMDPVHKEFYHPKSMVRYSNMTLLAKALFSLDRVEEARSRFGDAISILKVTYGEGHVLHQYLNSFFI